MVKRTEIIVYFNYKASIVQQFIDLGASVEYVNKKAGYAVCYVDGENQKKFTDAIKRIKGFKRYDFSLSELIELDF